MNLVVPVPPGEEYHYEDLTYTPLAEEEQPQPFAPDYELTPGMIEPADEIIEVNTLEWLEKCRYLEGQPISFKGQPWIRDMLLDSFPWQVWQTARQVAKSTSLVNKMITYGCNIPYLRQLYVSPTYNQTRLFSADRLRPAIFQSPPILQHYWNKSCRDQVLNRELATPSQILLNHCFLDADSVRGASAHVLMLDETQDLLKSAVEVLEETLSAARRMNVRPEHEAYLDLRHYCGTPKSYDTSLQGYWEDSTQNEWLVSCNHCGGGDYRQTWNILGDDNIAEEGLVCKKCGKTIDWTEGEWVERHPDAVWKGWHVSQLMCTEPQGWINWEKGIWYKKAHYLPQLFSNEVLGIPFDSGMRPVTVEQIKACCQPEYRLDSIVPGSQLDCFAGLDWQMDADSPKSFTILTIYALVGRRFQLQYAKKFMGQEARDPNNVINFIAKKMQEFNVKVIGADHGVGHKENERLKYQIPNGFERVMEFQYVMSGNHQIRYDADKSRFMIDRTMRMELFFEAIRQQWVWWPRWEDFEPYHHDIYSIFADYNVILRRRRYMPGREPDDFFHSSLYAWEALHKYYQGQLDFWVPTTREEVLVAS